VRLGTCIALELVVAAGSITGVWFGVDWVTQSASGYFSTHEAAADPLDRPLGEGKPVEVPESHLDVAPTTAPPPQNVFDAPDDVLLKPLAAAPITKVKVNQGGTSLSLRLDFENGARGSFKPLQKYPQSDPRREIAAFRMDRLLGLGHVAPAKMAVFTPDEIIKATPESMRWYTQKRLDEDASLTRKGLLLGEVQWWIPDIAYAKIDGWDLDSPEGMSRWSQYLQVGAKVPDTAHPILEQLSACILFDLLIDNADRWSGNNTQQSPDGKVLFFMDNTLSFSPYSLGHQPNLGALYRVQVFPRGLVAKMRALTQDQVTAAITTGDDGDLAPLLNQNELKAIIGRRDHILEYIDKLIAKYGEDAVLAYP
jgi:hypothetical protein